MLVNNKAWSTKIAEGDRTASGRTSQQAGGVGKEHHEPLDFLDPEGGLLRKKMYAMAVNSSLLDLCWQRCARVLREALEATLGKIEPDTLYLTQGAV